MLRFTPDSAPCLVGLQEGLTERRGDHGLLALGHVGERVPHPMHDANTIDAIRFGASMPFAGAGPVVRRRRRDARFP